VSAAWGPKTFSTGRSSSATPAQVEQEEEDDDDDDDDDDDNVMTRREMMMVVMTTTTTTTTMMMIVDGDDYTLLLAGKTTVARLYAKLLKEWGVLPASQVEETNGAKLAQVTYGRIMCGIKSCASDEQMTITQAKYP
jgi:hypothetical protein